MKQVLRQIDLWLQKAKDKQSNAMSEREEAFYRGKVTTLMKIHTLLRDKASDSKSL